MSKTETNVPIEIVFQSAESYTNPFMDVELDVEFVGPDKETLRVPGFWTGGNEWAVRYASSLTGNHTYTSICNTEDCGLNGIEGEIEITPYTGENPLYKHGPIGVSEDKRHFEHHDGTPFLWLADTWWKCLSKRMTLNDFKELASDRNQKGFSVVQIVLGPYPDEEMMLDSWENEGGKPYEKIDFSVMNPEYFEHADKRIEHLVESGLVPAIVGGWGRPQQGGESTLQQVGLEGFKRHWRNLSARYGSFPAVWIVGGETKDDYGPWPELAKYLKDIDPFDHPMCYHSPGHPRKAHKDNSMFDFDMIALGHSGLKTSGETLEIMKSCITDGPRRPTLCGECAYEEHMQTNFHDVQRHMFWQFMLNGAAGHTYGAAGVWQASVEGDPGITPVYDRTTWREGMQFPGSNQLGYSKRLLEKYAWERFEPHPEWTEEGNYAAGISGEVRFIYSPGTIYNWEGPTVKNLEPNVAYKVYYFDPVRNTRDDMCIVINRETTQGEKKLSELDLKPEDVIDVDGAEFQAPAKPSPQDWVLVMEKE